MTYYARNPYDDPAFDLDAHMAAAARYERTHPAAQPTAYPANRPASTAGGSDADSETPGPAPYGRCDCGMSLTRGACSGSCDNDD